MSLATPPIAALPLLCWLCACTPTAPDSTSPQTSAPEPAAPAIPYVQPPAQRDPNFQFTYPMQVVKGGPFTMGATNPHNGFDPDECPHEVNVRDFQMGKYEVTQTQWIAVMGHNPSGFNQCMDCPVERVTWGEAQQFIQKLNAITGAAYRLPTEAEWEYAARGGGKQDTTSNYAYAGVHKPRLRSVAWYAENSDRQTHPVGLRRPNALGLYDMNGNVHEWCQDRFLPYEGCPTQLPVADVGKRVARGGAWNSTYYACRVSDRMGVEPSARYLNLGLRLAHD